MHGPCEPTQELRILRQLGGCSRLRIRHGGVMEKLGLAFSLLALAVTASLTLSCGARSQGQGPLQSITLNPATADAQDYPNNQVQFVATGYYTNPSRTVTPLSATWGVCYQNAATSAISVTSTGLAQCASGVVGTYSVWADDPMPLGPGAYNCPASTACGGGCTIQASTSYR